MGNFVDSGFDLDAVVQGLARAVGGVIGRRSDQQDGNSEKKNPGLQKGENKSPMPGETHIAHRLKIDEIFRNAIDGPAFYAAFHARFIHGLSKHADTLGYAERAVFLRIAGMEAGFPPAEFWDAILASEKRAMQSAADR